MGFGVFDHVDDSGLPPAGHYAARLRIFEALDVLRFDSYHETVAYPSHSNSVWV